MNFQERLSSAIRKNNSLLCIGLDPVLDKLPDHIKADPHPFFAFNKAIIDATHDLVCGYKPNSAYYEALGAQGVQELKMTCDYIRTRFPDLLIILDAKRADIGHSNEGYVRFAYDYLQASAITLHPYLGQDSVQPFLDRADKGCIVLCRTSNPGAHEFQDVCVESDFLYIKVAKAVSTSWNTNQNCMLVVGATYPKELAEVRKIIGDMPILVPGIGAQGGDLEETLKSGLTTKKDGLVITVSRSVIFASKGDDFSEKARTEAEKLSMSINSFRQS